MINILLLYLGICIMLAYLGWKKRGNTIEDFFTTKRQTGTIITFMTFSATLYSSFMLVGVPGFFYTHGIGSFAFIIFADILMGLLVYYTGREFWQISKEHNIITMTGFIEKRYKSRTAMVIALLISFAFLLPYISTQIIGLGIILSNALNVSVIVISITVLIIIFLYSEMGGMRSVSWTDSLQGTILVVVGLMLMFGIISYFGGIESFFMSVRDTNSKLLSAPGPKGLFTMPMLFSFFLMIFLMPVTQPQLLMRFFLPKTKKALRTMLIAVPIYAILAIVPTIFIGFGAKLLDPNLVSGDMSFNTILQIFPEWIRAISIVGVVAASMSTADSQVLALASLVTRDLFRSKLKVARLSILVILILVFILSINPPKLMVTLSILSFAGTLQLAPTLIGGLFWSRGTANGAIWSMITGIGTLITYQWFFTSPLGFHSAFWGFIVSTIVYILVSLRGKRMELLT